MTKLERHPIGVAVYWYSDKGECWYAEGPIGSGQVYRCNGRNSALTMAATIDHFLRTGEKRAFSVRDAQQIEENTL